MIKRQSIGFEVDFVENTESSELYARMNQPADTTIEAVVAMTIKLYTVFRGVGNLYTR